jgi:hypothetical protein
MRNKRAKWLALGLAGAGIAVLSIVATAELNGGPLLIFAIGAAVFVLLMPVAAYFVFRRSRPADDR